MTRQLLAAALALAGAGGAAAADLRVPQDHKTVQAAVDAAKPGDTVVVAPGTYRESVRLRPRVALRSAGDDAPGAAGLRRAEATVIDGGKDAKQPGVLMAEGSTLDGFTVTNVGTYDEAVWKKHFDSQGEELGDEEGAVRAEGTNPAVSVVGVSCTVTRCVVHHNGDVGIGVLGKAGATTEPLVTGNLVYRNMGGGIGVAEGAEPVVRGNTCKENLRAGIGCRKANPVVTGNTCSHNVRAGIGVREGAKPVIRGNACFQNRRAGIGIRTEGTEPVVDGNECYENEMAGIGTRDGAKPVLRNNVCRKNKLAGIGARDGAEPLIVGNECRDNKAAGIGVQKANAVIHRNTCAGNELVAIGVTDGATATVTDNTLSRTGGQPPLIAVKDGSTATVRDNRISGGGVAAVLVQGKATVTGNTFTGANPKQGTAVWVWADSTATVADNAFTGYRTAVSATKAAVAVTGNTVDKFQGAAIIVKDSAKPAHVHGNTAVTADPRAAVVELSGPTGVVADNVIKKQ
ncbi:MAG: right-handed parallel beta-helix repeat-containing protein [Gemmata sp.]